MPRETTARARHALAVVEAGYSLEGTDAEWLARVLDAGGTDFEHGCGSYAFTCRLGARDLEMGAYSQRQLDPRFGALVAEMNETVPGAFFERVARSAILCGGFCRFAPEALAAHFRERGPAVGIVDSFFLFAQDGEGHAFSLNVPARVDVDAHARVRGVWTRVGVHVASAMRLRRRFSEARAVRDALFAPDGAVADATGDVREKRSVRATLAAAVRDVERARTRQERHDPRRALDLWRGLVAGEWSLVDHWEGDGRRYVAAYRNRPDVPDPRGLTPRERIVLKYASLGGSNKEIAFTLGISETGAASAVSQLLRKLRCSRRTDLLAFSDPARATHVGLRVGDDEVGVLAVPHAPRIGAMARLSAGEREVAQHVVAGLTNAAIARARGSSAHTVANQVRKIFEKLEVGSRTELARILTREA